MSHVRYISYRDAYTLFIMLGDVGGFNGAILILPAYLMNKYSERKYLASIGKEIPSRKTRQQGRKKDGDRRKVQRIEQDDIKGIYKEVLDTIKNTKVRFWEGFCHIGFLCKRFVRCG